MTNKNIRRQIKNLPRSPGVYQFYNAEGKILYVGKAADLRSRVSSYFNGHENRRQITKMIPLIERIRIQPTETGLGALLLESELIKRQTPPYNIRWKDDKNYIYLKITIRDDYPRLIITRKIINDRSCYFGPYVESRVVKNMLRYLERIFRFRICQQLPAKVCFQYHLGRCSGPCQKLISKKEYRDQIKQLIWLLSGKQKNLIAELSAKMKSASTHKQFEAAAIYRDRIKALSHIKEIAVFEETDQSKYQKNRNFRDSIRILSQTLSWPNLVKQSGLDHFRIEGYDISNISGKLATGSMVVFVDGVPAKDQYRKFRIKISGQPDDVAMMREMIGRRFGNHGADWPLPNIVIVDGGAGQLGAVNSVIEQYGDKIKAIPCLGLAKRLETIIIKRDNKYAKIILPKDSPAIYLLQNIRDEAHRFALGYHLIRRRHQAGQSLLDEIPKIGPIRKKKLLQEFGSIDKIKKAKLSRIAELIGRKSAEKVKEYI